MLNPFPTAIPTVALIEAFVKHGPHAPYWEAAGSPALHLVDTRSPIAGTPTIWLCWSPRPGDDHHVRAPLYLGDILARAADEETVVRDYARVCQRTAAHLAVAAFPVPRCLALVLYHAAPMVERLAVPSTFPRPPPAVEVSPCP